MSDNLKQVAPLEEFDWDSYAQGETYTKEAKQKLAETYDSTLSKISDKEVVNGIDRKSVV